MVVVEEGGLEWEEAREEAILGGGGGGGGGRKGGRGIEGKGGGGTGKWRFTEGLKRGAVTRCWLRKGERG